MFTLHRDTPHHLKNKRVQHNIDKSSNLILSKLKDKAPPLTQQIGLPIQEEHTPLETIKSGDEETQEGKY